MEYEEALLRNKVYISLKIIVDKRYAQKTYCYSKSENWARTLIYVIFGKE